MGFQHHRNWHCIESIEQGFQKIVLNSIRPTVAAGDQVDLQGFEACGPLKILVQLRQMIGRAPLQRRGVITTGDNLKNQVLLRPIQPTPDLRG